MIKTIELLAAREGVRHVDLIRALAVLQAPLVKVIPGLLGYIVNDPAPTPHRVLVPELFISRVDCIVELWFESMQAFWAAVQRSEMLELREARLRFVAREKAFWRRKRSPFRVAFRSPHLRISLFKISCPP